MHGLPPTFAIYSHQRPCIIPEPLRRRHFCAWSHSLLTLSAPHPQIKFIDFVNHWPLHAGGVAGRGWSGRPLEVSPSSLVIISLINVPKEIVAMTCKPINGRLLALILAIAFIALHSQLQYSQANCSRLIASYSLRGSSILPSKVNMADHHQEPINLTSSHRTVRANITSAWKVHARSLSRTYPPPPASNSAHGGWFSL